MALTSIKWLLNRMPDSKLQIVDVALNGLKGPEGKLVRQILMSVEHWLSEEYQVIQDEMKKGE